MTAQLPPYAASQLRRVARLWWLCAAVSAVALLIAAILSLAEPDQVNWVVWLRGSVVAAASVALAFAARAAARGNRRAYTRMRWISILAPIGIVLIILAPDTGYPVWMKVEQGLIGLIIAAIGVALNLRSVRTSFSDRAGG